MAAKAAIYTILAAGLSVMAMPAHADTPAKTSDTAKPVISKTTYWRKTAIVPNGDIDKTHPVLAANYKNKAQDKPLPAGKGHAKIHPDYDIVETYRISYKGRVYTNRVLRGDK